MENKDRRSMAPGRREEDWITKSQCLERGEFCKTLHEATQKHLEEQIRDIKDNVKQNAEESRSNKKLLWGLLILCLGSLVTLLSGIVMTVLKPMLVEALSKNAAVTIRLIGFFGG